MKLLPAIRKKRIVVLVGVYCLLWLLTASWGVSNIDRDFDLEFAWGNTFNSPPHSIPIQRLNTFANIRELEDPDNSFPPDIGPFRYRTPGYAIAPFLVIDEVAVIYAHLGGFGGKRVNLWFFGWTHWWLIQGYWAV